MTDKLQLLDLAIALGVGAMIGVERGWSQREMPEGTRVAGLRTFSLFGLFGGVAAAMGTLYGVAILAAVSLGAAGIVVASLVTGRRDPANRDITTEVALLLTFALGVLAGFGRHTEAVACAVVVTVLLGLKPSLHGWLKTLEREEMTAAFRLLVMSLVILPVLPNKGFGPWEALNPYVIWLMVVLISGLSFAGYIAVKHAGPRWGLIVTGLMGGLASSTAVAVTMARLGKASGGVQPAAATATVASSTVVYGRLLVVSAAFAPLLAWKLAPVLGAMALTGAVCVAIMWPRNQPADGQGAQALDDIKPFSLATPLRFAAILAIVMVASAGLQSWLGDGGLLLVSAIAGVTDVDAPALTVAGRVAGGLDAGVGALAILIAVAVNIVAKFVIIGWIGGAGMAKRVAPGLLLALPVGAAVWWFFAR